jgi:hypothetical protein
MEMRPLPGTRKRENKNFPNPLEIYDVSETIPKKIWDYTGEYNEAEYA